MLSILKIDYFSSTSIIVTINISQVTNVRYSSRQSLQHVIFSHVFFDFVQGTRLNMHFGREWINYSCSTTHESLMCLVTRIHKRSEMASKQVEPPFDTYHLLYYSSSNKICSKMVENKRTHNKILLHEFCKRNTWSGAPIKAQALFVWSFSIQKYVRSAHQVNFNDGMLVIW